MLRVVAARRALDLVALMHLHLFAAPHLGRSVQAHAPGDYDAALADLEAAIELDGDDANLRTLQATYRKEVHARREAQKKAYSKMFA